MRNQDIKTKIPAKVAFTASIPAEVILAAHKVPVDLNNVFITAPAPLRWVEQAEMGGYPRNACSWIKGMYALVSPSDYEAVIAVVHGDCSNTEALAETWRLKRVATVPFAYPHARDRASLKREIDQLADRFAVPISAVEAVRRDLQEVRDLAADIDRLTWQENVVSGGENHLYLVNCSDFQGDPCSYRQQLANFIATAHQREPFQEKVRLAYIGVPPIFSDLYEVLESLGARVVFNEVQREFSMPLAAKDIYEQYLLYSYPYGAFARLGNILPELAKRNIDGIIHYTQTFCYRQIEDIIYRQRLPLPVLSLEGERPGAVDMRTRMRLEAFITMLAAQK